MVKLKIISNGSTKSQDTKVVDAETGEMLKGVTSVKWKASIGEIPTAEITIRGIEIDVEGQATMPGVWINSTDERPHGAIDKLLVYTPGKGIFEASFHNGTFFTKLGNDFHPDIWMIIPAPTTDK